MTKILNINVNSWASDMMSRHEMLNKKAMKIHTNHPPHIDLTYFLVIYNFEKISDKNDKLNNLIDSGDQ